MVDADGGGSVDIDEFMELMRTKTKEAQDEVVIKEILQKLDDTLSEADLGDLIAEIDSDGSGWVDYDEFKALMLGYIRIKIGHRSINAPPSGPSDFFRMS